MKLKTLTCTITAGVLLFSASTALGTTKGINRNTQMIEDVKLISAPIREMEQSNFKSYEGIIKSIEDYKSVKGSKIVQVEDNKGGVANLIISENTYFINDNKIEVGARITGYYDATRPMIMIYPPQYTAEVVVIGDIKESVKVDLFNENLVSVDSQLKIKVYNDTEVITQDGKKYEGKLTNKNLVVIYDIATKSIPAQTAPIKVIVLNKEANIANDETTEESIHIGIDDKNIMIHLLRAINKLIVK
ncbi:hypothetical protein GOM49_15460 [Clostridium bovifaecis]|uniref:Uncharacterized protein n=1 Tax=Clostridium bovifaecis TaxID=2184719 RepID=A0A6I6EZG0_9CLOT|nr:hypothetical protein GOM49_15460 [Clostridium bovifaecis]